MEKIHPIDKFIQSSRSKGRNITDREFASFCHDGIELALRYPDKKDKIAYEIVEKGWNFGFSANERSKDTRKKIWNLAASLELPDEHVYIGEGISIQQGWQMLKELSDELDKEQC